MSIRVTRANSPFDGPGEVSEIDLFDGVNLNTAQKAEASRDVGEYLVSQINQYLNRASSPVQGGRYKSSLSTEYKAFKRDQGGSSTADLELTGEMRDDISYRVTPTGVQVGVFGRNDSAMKADGHNNFSGRSSLPQRQFLPDVSGSFKSQITRGINDIIASKKVEGGALSMNGLSNVSTRSELNDWIEVQFPGISRAAAARAILGNPDTTLLFEQLGFLPWLTK